MNANEVTERKTELSNKNMRFIDSEISPGKAKTTAVYGDSAYEMFFEFNQPIDIELDDFALALSTLGGKEFEEIRFDLPLSPETSVKPRVL